MPKLKAEFQKTKLTLCNTNYVPLGVLTNKTHLSAHNIMLSQAVNDTATLSFDIAVGGLINTDSTELLIKHKNEYYVIKEIEMSNGEQAVAKVRAEHIACELKGIMVGYFEELIGETPSNMWNTVVTNSTMAEVINSKYVFETNIIDTFRYLSSEDEKSVFEYLITIAQQFDACILFSTDTYGVIHINLLYGDIDRGRFVRKGKDLKQLDLTFNTEALFTKITPFGATDDDGVEVTIMDVNDGKSYLTNYNYYLSKGMTMDEISSNPLCNQECVYRNEDIDDPTELLRLATDELEKISQPVVDGNISTIDLNAFEGSLYLTPILCEKIIAIDKDTNYAISCRVTSVDYNYENPLETQIGISNVIRYNSTLKDLVHQGNILDKVITNDKNGKPNINASKVHGIIDGHIAQLKYSMEDSITDITDAVVLFENRIEGDKMFGALAIGARGILISTKIDPVTNQWVWTTAIDAKGMSTQVINAVTINGSQIRGDIISSFDEKTWINLDDGTFNFADKITYDGTTFQIKLGNGTDVEDWMREYENDKEVLEGKLEEVKDKIENLDITLDDSFADGIITEVERNRIEDSLKQLYREKQDIDQRYNTIYSDVNLIGTSKTNLAIAYNNFNTKYNSLIFVINEIIVDDKVTDTEKSSYNTALDDYNATIPPLTTAFDNAIKTISSNDAKTQIGDLEDALEGDIKNVSDNLNSLEETMTTSFKDGIITEAEYNTIKENIARLDAEKLDITRNYQHLSVNPNLEESVLTELTNSYNQYQQRHSTLIEYVDVTIGDRIATEAEIEMIRTLLSNYDEALANYRVSQTKAVNSIAEMTAENNLNEYKQLVDKDIQDVNKRVSDLVLDVGGAIVDGVLEEAELLIIENSIRELEREKSDIDSRYNAIKSNANISTSFRDGTLLQKYNAFNTAHNNLINAINNMVDDSTATASEKIAFENATASYNTALGELSETFDGAINDISRNMSNAIMEALKTELQANINDVQGSIDDLDDYLSTSFRDGILTDAEKETIRTHLRTLATEKKDIDQQYDTLYNMDDLTGTAKSNLRTAYNDYVTAYNSLVTSINNILEKTTITASDRTSLNTAFTTHDTELGDYSKRVNEAIEAIAEKKNQDLSDTVSAKITTLEDSINLCVKTETLEDLSKDLQNQLDGKIQTYYQPSDPSTSWTDETTKTQHTGDLWYDINSVKMKRWNGMSWVAITDKDASDAKQLASTKAQIFTSTPTPPYYKGDLWCRANDEEIMRSIANRTSGSFVSSDWVKASKYTDDTTANEVKNDLATNYYTITETESAINISKDSILSTVSSTYTTKNEMGNTLANYAKKSELSQTADSITATFTSSGGTNLLKNSDAKEGTKFWLDNGGGLSINTSGADPFIGGNEFKTNFPSGMRYYETIKLKGNTDYVYEGWIFCSGSDSGSATVPLHYWCMNEPGISGQDALTVLDYRQNVTSGRFNKCYVHFKTKSGDIYFTPFIYGLGDGGWCAVRQLSLKESKVETAWTPHASEIYEGITKIDQDGIEVSHSHVSTKSQMTAGGFFINDNNGDVIAELSSTNQWSILRADEVYAKNIERVYMGDANLYVDHSKGTCGTGTSSSPFNSFSALTSHFEDKGTVLNKDVTVYVVSTGNVSDNLDIRGLSGRGTLTIRLTSSLILNSNSVTESAIYFYDCDTIITVNGGRSAYNSTDGALLNKWGCGVRFTKCKYGRVECLAVDSTKNNKIGVTFDATDGIADKVDTCTCYHGLWATRGSQVYQYDCCGSASTSFYSGEGALIQIGGESNSIKISGSYRRATGNILDFGTAPTQQTSYRTPPAVPPTSDRWQSFSFSDYGYYSVGQACWNPNGKKVYQGDWG